MNLSDTPWYSDVLGDPERDPDFYTIKVGFYLDAMDADSGSLRVIPGSHFPAYEALLDECGYKEGGLRPRLHLEDPPGAVATQPGDVVLFDTRPLRVQAGGARCLSAMCPIPKIHPCGRIRCGH